MTKETTNLKDIRWKQRFVNFEKAYARFEDALSRDTKGDDILRAGLIQTFEFVFELAWKTLKDKLEAGGVEALLPREVIKEAFQARFIEDGKMWQAMLDTRNKLSHLYEEKMSNQAEKDIRDSYAPLLMALNSYLKKSL